jgi:hypothetical protein
MLLDVGVSTGYRRKWWATKRLESFSREASQTNQKMLALTEPSSLSNPARQTLSACFNSTQDLQETYE